MIAEHAGGLKILGLIGQGGSGRVYLAEDEDGERLALKRFDESAVNLPLFEQMTRRLAAGGWPPGVMPVIRPRSGAGTATRMGPVFVDDAGGLRSLRPLSLQHELGEHPGDSSWMRVKSLARALAGMHERGVAHGNLKPGNVFIGPDDELLLTDWALGNMPGVRAFPFTDALLYQPPEQLRDPSGYRRAAGFGWDVFAFGVLAYRILTGFFPRCHAVYQQVAPAAGTSDRQDLQVDRLKVAGNLEAQAVLPWPDTGPGTEERELRECINRCLSLDPASRPADMARVAADFQRIEAAARDALGPGAEPSLWSHIHPMRALGWETSKGDPMLSERDLWDFDDEIRMIEAMAFGHPDLEAAGLASRPKTDSPGPPPDSSTPVSAAAAADDVWIDAPAMSGEEASGPTAQDAPIAEKPTGFSPSVKADPATWLEGEAADWENAADSSRRSRSRERSTPLARSSTAPEERRSRKWSFGDHLGVMLLAATLLACGGWVLGHTILKLPEKAHLWETPAFPIAGERIQLESAACYWRPPVTDGPRADTCRRGTLLLPVVEISVTGGTSTLRVLFKNEEGKTTGDALIRTVRSGDTLKLAGTAGLEDSGAWAAYRIGDTPPWSVQIHEILSESPADGHSMPLLDMPIPGGLR